ncbi:MAG: Crp/Fnr family transcriptional regulator [Deltaproteobacteria bacterium]|nr:Crp/Fnr family transcriptional regulator [Deltaproteobacteria bacterium]
MPIKEQISSIPLFEGLPGDQLEELSSIIVDLDYQSGQSIFSEGDEGAGFYVVVSGRVKIFKISADGKEQILHIFDHGEPFGEVAVFAGMHFPANAEAMERSRILYFPRDALVGLIQKDPFIALNMLAVLSRRLRGFAALIEDLSLKEVPGRLAAHLLFLSEQKKGSKDFELTITKGQLASLLGTIPETLSRILTKMSKQGLIESNGARIKILDRDALQDLAEGLAKI